MAAQNQHYVPKFILRQFLCDAEKEQVTVYDKHDDKIFTTAIKNIMAERRFHDFAIEEWTTSFEPVATKIEQTVLPVYTTILETRRLERPLQKLVPTADDLLRMSAPQLAPLLLKLAEGQRQSAGFIPDAVSDFVIGDGYPGHKKSQVDTHLARAWNWIERKGLIEPSPGINGQHGWRMFSEEGEAIAKGATLEAIQAAQGIPVALLHADVLSKCQKLFESGHYPEAVEKSFRLVRDRLRALTGFEKGSEAFGKGKLHIKGAIAFHVDKDFNEAVKFLTMAIDMFRNEKTHTSETGVDDPTKALQYLILSSLAMRLLDGAEVP
jgi:uncharacterized protein (TIGR02391 family)